MHSKVKQARQVDINRKKVNKLITKSCSFLISIEPVSNCLNRNLCLSILLIQMWLRHTVNFRNSCYTFFFVSLFKFNFVDGKMKSKQTLFFFAWHFWLSKSRSGKRAKVVLKRILQIKTLLTFYLRKTLATKSTVEITS